MEHLVNRLRGHLDLLRQSCGAEGASVFLPSPWSGSEPFLLHTGAAVSVAELAELADARRFHEQYLESWVDGGAAPKHQTVQSATPGGVLLPIPCSSHLVNLGGDLPTVGGPKRRDSDRDFAEAAGWLGLTFSLADASDAGGQEHPRLLSLASTLARTFMTLSALGADPLGGLPGRAELHSVVREGLLHATRARSPYSLLLVNPDEFERVNERFGRAAGDLALREVVSCLRGALRLDDLVMRYGGAIFAVVLSGTNATHAAAVAEKVRSTLTSAGYVGGPVVLQFSVGAASWEPGDEPLTDSLQLIQRADAALAMAKQSGGAAATAWTPEAASRSSARVDRLGAVFTGDQNRDYRNFALLWDALTEVPSAGSVNDLAARFADQLLCALRPAQVGVFEFAKGQIGPAMARRRDSSPGLRQAADEEEEDLAASDLALLAQACVSGAPKYVLTRGNQCVLAIPVRAATEVVAGLLMVGPANRLRADVADLAFLGGFASGVGLAIDRARLAAQERERGDRERHRLAGELKELRSVLRQVKLVYSSVAVENVVFDARRVADTDATVLITGESGTGKELLAQTIHQVSCRRKGPFVIVDCGAIPPNLIESELFGFERGAFTGAVTRSAGRIIQADGGTILLDEVGELPLEVQTKLLRFVEEKQFTSVGAHHVRRVDVRVLAATNRDLAQDVKTGRFRLDLYHRLSVVPLTLPPLRQRDDDVLVLARHFLDAFAAKYQKAVHDLSPELQARMKAYSWPGNVRELQNRLLRAVLLADDATLTPAQMPLPDEDGAPPVQQDTPGAVAPLTVVAEVAEHGQRAGTASPHGVVSLREALATAVAASAAIPVALRPPLGRWLADDLVLAALTACDGVARRAAAAVGLPDTTCARRLERAQRDARLGARPAYWSAVQAAVAQLVRQHKSQPEDTCLLDVAETCLIAEIERRFPGDQRAGAALLGTSLPTFRRRVTALPLAS